ncbi:BrnA antitoxin family protein [Herbaspirillum sp. C9C3]|uniref:BrnA antitoxin family protein n=1 Tax=Herbaspirillum sp. C9C3 TaxID=2735271 RepID=UPI0015856588|nr:BrnA antitoxin family protein [Herbaspirillum sp. C9C3]NUT63514.1 BrnA antitoxin family protein [Herbaspirillum sp. C9C3]
MPKIKQGALPPDDAEDAAITAAALSDPDNPPLTAKDFEAMQPARSRGRPAGSGTKVQVTMRFDIDVLEAFKSQGAGWQSRMNGALREWLAQHR